MSLKLEISFLDDPLFVLDNDDLIQSPVQKGWTHCVTYHANILHQFD